jgi:hypothetical protein
MKSTLFRTSNSIGEKSSKILKKYNINFREVFSDDYDIPVLITKYCAFSYCGLNEIENYCKSIKK